jgi:enoyl-CoA hydratase/carnithine racemase
MAKKTERRGSGLHIDEAGDGIATLTLSRPAVANAIDPELAQELVQYFAALADRVDIRVVVLRGEGRNFCAGFDLNRVDDITASTEQGMRLQRLMSGIVLRMRRCPQPIVCLVQGAASGAGFALALAADVRVAAPDARMNVAMALVGLTGCDMGISYFLPRLAGAGAASELMLTGRFVDAARAERLGLISCIVEREQLQAAGRSVAQDMLRLSPEGLRLTKEGLNNALSGGSLEEVVALEDRGQAICIGRYMKEGVAAFREKRLPDYAPPPGAGGA